MRKLFNDVSMGETAEEIICHPAFIEEIEKQLRGLDPMCALTEQEERIVANYGSLSEASVKGAAVAIPVQVILQIDVDMRSAQQGLNQLTAAFKKSHPSLLSLTATADQKLEITATAYDVSVSRLRLVR